MPACASSSRVALLSSEAGRGDLDNMLSARSSARSSERSSEHTERSSSEHAERSSEYTEPSSETLRLLEPLPLLSDENWGSMSWSSALRPASRLRESFEKFKRGMSGRLDGAGGGGNLGAGGGGIKTTGMSRGPGGGGRSGSGGGAFFTARGEPGKSSIPGGAGKCGRGGSPLDD
mmetsp:Transcript_53266/g.171848  ORF Transcript_53266/g.171848 Transcript_53266/m.171848 type:complete len:175 (+) Transcript_53266:960-1484(+)